LHAWIRKSAGPILTLVLLMIIYFMPWPSAAPAFALVVYSAYSGGFVSSLVSALLVIAYMVLVYPPDLPRLVAAITAVLATAAMVAVLKRQAELSQSINGNVEQLRGALGEVNNLLDNWRLLSDEGKRYRIVRIEDVLANVLTKIYGWRAVKAEIEDAKKMAGAGE
jgi:hypothetical protein